LLVSGLFRAFRSSSCLERFLYNTRTQDEMNIGRLISISTLGIIMLINYRTKRVPIERLDSECFDVMPSQPKMSSG
jgi:hypothetical protein